MSTPRRSYDSTKRTEKAIETRTKIINAAIKLYSKSGIDSVSVEALAQEAKVSVPSIYQIFKSKAGLLNAMMENALFDTRSLGLTSKIDTLESPKEILEMTAEIACTIYENESKVLGIVRGASSFSPTLKQAEKKFEDIRYQMQKSRCEKLEKMNSLRPNIKVIEARQIMWMYTSREIYRMLVLEKKWSIKKYKKWLSKTLYFSLISEIRGHTQEAD